MKRYLIYQKYGDLYVTNDLTKQHLIDLKNGSLDLIVDTNNWTSFDPETNTWKEIKKK